MLEVADNPLRLDTVKVIVNKGSYCQSKRYVGRHGGRGDAGDETQQVAGDDEQEDAGHKCLEGPIAVADALLRQPANSLMNNLGKLLGRARLLH